MQAATRIGIHHIFFYEAYLYLISKSFQKLSLLEPLFLLKQSYSSQNAVADVFMKIFWNTHTKIFGKYPEKRI